MANIPQVHEKGTQLLSLACVHICYNIKSEFVQLLCILQEHYSASGVYREHHIVSLMKGKLKVSRTWENILSVSLLSEAWQ